MPRTGPPRGAPAPFKPKPKGAPMQQMPPKPKGAPVQMMAGGGFGAPGPLGSDAPPPPDISAGGAPGGADPDMDGDMDSPTVKPESVNYHDDAQSCSQCQYMGDGGMCSVLKMQVSPDGGCNAFEGGGASADMDADAGMGADTDMMGGPPPGGPPPGGPPPPSGGSPFGRGR